MPKIDFAEYKPGDRDVFKLGEEERSFRHNLINLFWSYYDGAHKKFLDVSTGTFDDNVIVNLCSQAIDRFVSFLFPEVPKLTYNSKRLDKALQSIWDDEEYIPTFLTDIGISGLVSGHVFVRLDNSNPEEVKFVNLDPRLMTVFWDVRDSSKALWYRMTWLQDDTKYTGQKYYIEDYVPATFINPGESGWYIILYEWKPNTQATIRLIEQEKWDYEFAPIVDWKAQPKPFTFYGPSLLRHLHVNDVVNFLWSNTIRILKFHAHPKTIILGAGQQDLQQTAIDEVWAIPVAGAEVFNLEMQSDLQASLEMQDKARAAFFAQSHVVDTTTQRDKIGQITNFGLHVLFSDMLDHTRLVQQLYGKGLQELLYRALVIMNKNPKDRPFIKWHDPLPVNRTELVNSVKVEQSVGYTSPQTLAESLGRDFEQEQANIKDAKATNITLNLALTGLQDLEAIEEANKKPETPAPAVMGKETGETDEWDDSERLQRSIESV